MLYSIHYIVKRAPLCRGAALLWSPQCVCVSVCPSVCERTHERGDGRRPSLVDMSEHREVMKFWCWSNSGCGSRRITSPLVLFWGHSVVFRVLNISAKFWRGHRHGALSADGVYKFGDFLSNRPRIGLNQGCHKCFLRVKNYPSEFTHAAAAANTVSHMFRPSRKLPSP